MISKTNFQYLVDSIANQYTMSYNAGISSAASATLNLDRVVNSGDEDEENALNKGFRATLDNLTVTNIYKAFDTQIRGINNYVDGVDSFCTSSGATVPPEFKTLYEQIMGVSLTIANGFSPEVNMGTFTYSATSAGSFSDGLTLDLALYPIQQLTARVLSGFTATGTVTVTAKASSSGSPVTKVVTIPPSSGVGIEVAVGSGSDKYYDVTNVSLPTGAEATASVGIFAKRSRDVKTD